MNNRLFVRGKAMYDRVKDRITHGPVDIDQNSVERAVDIVRSTATNPLVVAKWYRGKTLHLFVQVGPSSLSFDGSGMGFEIDMPQYVDELSSFYREWEGLCAGIADPIKTLNGFDCALSELFQGLLVNVADVQYDCVLHAVNVGKPVQLKEVK